MIRRLLVFPLLLLALVAATAANAAGDDPANPPGALRFFDQPGPPPASGADPLLGSCLAPSRDAALGTQRCSGPLARGLDGAHAVAFSPDPDGAGPRPAAERLYVASPDANAVAVLVRDPGTGALGQPDHPATPEDEGCISEGGRGGCVAGVGLRGVTDVAAGPDGGTIYAAARDGDAVTALRVAPDGSLTQQGLDHASTPGDDACVSEGGAGGCVAGRGLAGAAGLAVAPDGETIYAAAGESDAVAVLRRSELSGGLAQPAGAAGCVHDPRGRAPSPPSGCARGRALDGAGGVALAGDHVYVTARRADAVAGFRRSAADGSLAQLAGADGCLARTLAGCRRSAGGLNGASAIAFDSTGRSAYVAAAAGDALLAARRDPARGGLTPQRCYSDRTERSLCTDAPALDGATSVAVSPDGAAVYVGARNRSAIGTFRRVADGTLRLEPAPAGRTWTDGCLSWRGHTWVGEQDLSKPDHSDHRCARGLGLLYPGELAVSPDNGHVYVAAGWADAVTQLRRLPAGEAWAPDDTAPGTRAAGPRGRVRSRSAGFVIAPVGRERAVLECRLDAEPWRRCVNPVRRRRLAPGRHVFRVRAVDPSGNADASPARVVWRIVRR